MYERTDIAMESLRKTIRKEFAKSRQMMSMDELNVLQGSRELYSKLDISNQTVFLKLACVWYIGIISEEEEKLSSLSYC